MLLSERVIAEINFSLIKCLDSNYYASTSCRAKTNIFHESKENGEEAARFGFFFKLHLGNQNMCIFFCYCFWFADVGLGQVASTLRIKISGKQKT